jgi:prepilin signal peptidase PulO-like enzyme (type II secretory pathway)
VSQGKWIGGGDVKLGAVLGILLGSATFAFMMIFLSSVLALLIMLPLLFIGKTSRKTLIPYGPFLMAATYLIFLFGSRLIILLNGHGIYF